MPLERFSAAWRESYIVEATERQRRGGGGECVFCTLAHEPVGEESGVLHVSEHSFVCLNAYPYGSGHLLVLPRRHVGDMGDLSEEEGDDLFRVVRAAGSALQRAYGPDGMNIGMNLGSAGGAGIPEHLHVHALPRWHGDTNFMTTIGETRVLPESLASTWAKVHAAWSVPGPASAGQ